MSKPRPIQLTIPNPCSQSWDEMTPGGLGRHCTHCHKTVVDFTTWSDTALYDFFSKNAGHTCGRFFAEQLARPIHIPPQPHSRLYRITVALGLTLMFVQGGVVHAQLKAPLASKVTFCNDAPTIYSSKFTGEISGVVTDEQGRPVTNAWVGLFRDTVYERSMSVDSAGKYSIRRLAPGLYRMSVDALEYKTEEVRDILVNDDQTTVVSVKMDEPFPVEGGKTIMTGDVAIETPGVRMRTKKHKK